MSARIEKEKQKTQTKTKKSTYYYTMVDPVFFSLIVAVQFGLMPIFHKQLLHVLKPNTILVVSWVLYSLACLIFAIINKDNIARDAQKNLKWKHVGILAITAVVCNFFGHYIYYNVLKNNDSHIVTALIFSSPIVTLLIAYFYLKEKISFVGFTGVCLIVLGVICIAFNQANRYRGYLDYHA